MKQGRNFINNTHETGFIDPYDSLNISVYTTVWRYENQRLQVYKHYTLRPNMLQLYLYSVVYFSSLCFKTSNGFYLKNSMKQPPS